MEHRIADLRFGGKGHSPETPVLTHMAEIDRQEVLGRIVRLRFPARLGLQAVVNDPCENFGNFRVGTESLFERVRDSVLVSVLRSKSTGEKGRQDE